MVRGKFIFGGRSTEEFALRVEKFPAMISPARRRQTKPIAGRNGNLHYQENAFDNYIQPYQCYFHGLQPAPIHAHAVKAWLSNSGAYQRLQDSYDPEHYRLATFAGPLDIENIFNKFGRCVINFDCDPRSFLISGDTACAFDTPSALWNPTLFDALPTVTVYGSGAGTVTVGAVTVKIHEITDQLILDCENQNACRQVGDGAPENKNLCIYAPVFPVLQPGENPISFTGDITKIEITPRWWEL